MATVEQLDECEVAAAPNRASNSAAVVKQSKVFVVGLVVRLLAGPFERLSPGLVSEPCNTLLAIVTPSRQQEYEQLHMKSREPCPEVSKGIYNGIGVWVDDEKCRLPKI